MPASARLEIPGTYNFRDVGGYPCRGGVSRSGVLYRSDGLARLSDTGRDELVRRDVRTVIDLRDEYEVTAQPDALDGVDLTRISRPVFEGSAASQADGTITLDALYARITTRHASVVVQAIRDIASARPGAVLVHCTAGKDRTGVVIALALLAVGVPRTVVLEDYAATEENLAGEWLDGMVAVLGRYNVPDTPEIRVLMGGSPPEALGATIDRIEGEHGSVRDYLVHSGLTPSELRELESRLVETN